MGNNKPRILVIENSIGVTGALKSITRTAFDLNSFFDFQFVIPKHSKGRSWIEAKLFTHIYELPMLEVRKAFGNLVFYFPCLLLNAIRLNRLLKRESISLVHVNDIYNMLPVVLRAFGSRTPYVCHVRFVPDRFPPLLFNFWLRMHIKYSERIIAVSESVRQQLPAHEKISVVYNELPVQEVYPATLTHDDSTVRTFLNLSNFMEGKGQNFVLEAFARIHSLLPSWRLRFVGGDMGLEKNRKYRHNLKVRAQQLNIYEKVDWCEFTDDVELEYKLADIILNFSESESFSITSLEALYFGRPLIVTNCGGPVEIVQDGVTGLLVPNRDIEEMAQTMLELANNPELSEALGKNGRESVRAKFSVENTSFRIKAIYDSGLGVLH